MTTDRQNNIKKVQQKRSKPGTTGEGEYYHIIVRPKGGFATFRYQDVGDPGHILRHAGQRKSGSWDTHAWLISKEDAHVDGNKIIPDTEDARKLLETLGSVPSFVKGDIFEAKDRPDIPESEKPTEAQKEAYKARSKKMGNK